VQTCALPISKGGLGQEAGAVTFHLFVGGEVFQRARAGRGDERAAAGDPCQVSADFTAGVAGGVDVDVEVLPGVFAVDGINEVLGLESGGVHNGPRIVGKRAVGQAVRVAIDNGVGAGVVH